MCKKDINFSSKKFNICQSIASISSVLFLKKRKKLFK